MRLKTSRLLMILLCAAPLALAACQNHEHPGENAEGSSSSDEHPGDSGSANTQDHSASDDSGSGGSEHPGDG